MGQQCANTNTEHCSRNTRTYTLVNNKWNEITADITGSGSTKLTFTTNGRLWINEVSVTALLETGIDNVVNENARPADNRIYTLGGQYGAHSSAVCQKAST